MISQSDLSTMFLGSRNNQFDDGEIFSGGGFMTPSTQAPDHSPTLKSRSGARSVMPLTVKQISEAVHFNDNNIFAVNVRLLGMVENKVEKLTDVSFTLDDGTGRIGICKWVNDSSDATEIAAIQNGMYVKVRCHLKGFQSKGQAMAFSVQPVSDFNDVALHFIECIHVHLESSCKKVREAIIPVHTNSGMQLHFLNRVVGSQGYNSNQILMQPGTSGLTDETNSLVLRLFQEPASLAREHGLHVDEVARRLGLPMSRIMNAINYHADTGNIYSTIDENHFMSASNC